MVRYAAAAVLSVMLTSSGHHQKNNNNDGFLLCSAFVAPTSSTLPASMSRPSNAQISSASSLLRMSTHPGERVTDGRIVDPSASDGANPSADRKSPPPLPLTSDPLSVLGLDASPTSSPSGYIPSTAVKRAYRQRTAQYHPDAILSPDSTKEERQRANDDFARITAAYEAAVAQQVQYQIRTDADITTTEVGGTTIGVGINVFAYDFDRKKEELDRSRAAAGAATGASGKVCAIVFVVVYYAFDTDIRDVANNGNNWMRLRVEVPCVSFFTFTPGNSNQFICISPPLTVGRCRPSLGQHQGPSPEQSVGGSEKSSAGGRTS